MLKIQLATGSLFIAKKDQRGPQESSLGIGSGVKEEILSTPTINSGLRNPAITFKDRKHPGE